MPRSDCSGTRQSTEPQLEHLCSCSCLAVASHSRQYHSSRSDARGKLVDANVRGWPCSWSASCSSSSPLEPLLDIILHDSRNELSFLYVRRKRRSRVRRGPRRGPSEARRLRLGCPLPFFVAQLKITRFARTNPFPYRRRIWRWTKRWRSFRLRRCLHWCGRLEPPLRRHSNDRRNPPECGALKRPRIK